MLKEGNGTPLQYSCLEDPMDGGAWQAAVHGVTKSRTRLSDFTFTFHFHALEKEMATRSSVLAWRIPSVGCHLWGRTELDMTEATQQQLSATIPCNYATILYPNQSLLNKHPSFLPVPNIILDFCLFKPPPFCSLEDYEFRCILNLHLPDYSPKFGLSKTLFYPYYRISLIILISIPFQLMIFKNGTP